MGLITLTTDLGTTDSYVASVKGAIYNVYPEATVIDITHQIHPADIYKAAFVLKTCINDFPDGTTHIIGVDSEATTNKSHVVVQYKNQFFIGTDNGIFSLIFDVEPQKVVELDFSLDSSAINFPTRDVFVKAACHLAKGGTIEFLGKAKNSLKKLNTYRAIPEQNAIVGLALYIDNYGNVITNITKNMFVEFGKGRSFEILFRRKNYNINKITNNYNDVPDGERLALFSSTGYIEIAINKGKANKLLGINQNDMIRIEFYD